MRSAVVLCALSLALAFEAACGVKEDAMLTVHAGTTVLSKGTNAFGSKLDGAVDIIFDLGQYTRGNMTVEAIQLGLFRDTKQVVPSATFAPPPGTNFPFELAPGQKHTIKYTITKASLTADEATDLCAGPVRVTGSVKQVGQGEIRIGSDAIVVTGC